eukprot:symbB.v1.2.037057.t1/scaffold5246.1/size29401/4
MFHCEPQLNRGGSQEFRSASRSCGGCGEDIFNELKQELQHPLNTGFATPTQSTDLSFLSQMRQKLLQSKADRPEDLSQSLGCDSTSFALTERSRHELNRQKLMQGGRWSATNVFTANRSG